MSDGSSRPTPRRTSPSTMPAFSRWAAGIEEGLIRLGVGLEDVSDIRADLERGLK